MSTIENQTESLNAQTFSKKLWHTRKFLPKSRVFWIFAVILVFFVWFTPWVFLLKFASSIEVTRLDAKGLPIEVEVGPSTKPWVSIQHVSRHLINAIVVAEDSKFYEHNGFDFDAMYHAYQINRKKGKFVRGGSTISQQVVKMAFLTREKTYTRKIREALGTLIMEIILPKEKILEWYINLTEFGGGIYGVKQAGQYYFKTRPELLTTEQAIHLTVVIPSPNKWSKGLRAKNLTPFGLKRFGRIAFLLKKSGYISEAQYQTILATGNFGRPIRGYSPPVDKDDEDDDCKGDKDCEQEKSFANPLVSSARDNASPEQKKNSQDLDPTDDSAETPTENSALSQTPGVSSQNETKTNPETSPAQDAGTNNQNGADASPTDSEVLKQ